MAYDEHSQGRLHYLNRAREKSTEPLKISETPTPVQAFLFSQVQYLNTYLVNELGDLKSPNLERFFKSLIHHQLGRFEQVECDFEKETITIDNYIDAGYIIGVFQKHALIFRFLDSVEIDPKKWVIVDCDINEVQLIIFTSGIYETKSITDRLARAVQFARSKDWTGSMYYTRCDAVTNTKIE